MNVIHFTGNVGKDAETRSTQKGDVCSFSVGVRNGQSRDADTIWYRCTIWGQRGQNLAGHIKKGAKVAIVGDLSFGEYDGKPQYNVNVLDIDPFCGGKRDTESTPSNYGSAGQNCANASGGYDPARDDDVPF